MDPEKTAPNKSTRQGAWALWIGVIIMFLIVICAWVILIKLAKDNPVETIDTQKISNAAPSRETTPGATQTESYQASDNE